MNLRSAFRSVPFALLALGAADARAQGPCNLQWVPPQVDPQFDDTVYEVWYRDSANFCTGATSNISSGIRLVW